MAYQVCDIRPSTGMTRSQSNEHLRNYSQRAYENKRTGNFDPTREHLNFEVVSGGFITPVNKGKSIDERINENIRARGVSDPNEGLSKDDPKRRKIIADFILQGSREQMRKLAFGEQEIDEDTLEHECDNSHLVRKPEIEEWAKDMHRFMCERFGEKNIAAFVVHLDETNPHVHCTVLSIGNVKGKERFSWTSNFGTNKYEASSIFRNIHDELAEVNAKYGLERGRSVRETGARHRTTEEYWRELSESCTSLEKKKAQAEKRVKALTTMVGNLNVRILELEGEITQREMDIDETDKKAAEELLKLKQQHNELVAKIEDKKAKLRDAERQLAHIGEKTKESQEVLDKTIQQIDTVLPRLSNPASTIAESVAWNVAHEEVAKARAGLERQRKELPIYDREAFDKGAAPLFDTAGILNDMAEKANEIIATATMLFLGYIDQAAQYVQTQGGSGGDCSGLKRKKDEDDRDFMGRCFGMARMMMRPAARKLRR